MDALVYNCINLLLELMLSLSPTRDAIANSLLAAIANTPPRTSDMMLLLAALPPAVVQATDSSKSLWTGDVLKEEEVRSRESSLALVPCCACAFCCRRDDDDVDYVGLSLGFAMTAAKVLSSFLVSSKWSKRAKSAQILLYYIMYTTS
jgi:hypothetical protein